MEEQLKTNINAQDGQPRSQGLSSYGKMRDPGNEVAEWW